VRAPGASVPADAVCKVFQRLHPLHWQGRGPPPEGKGTRHPMQHGRLKLIIHA